MKNIPQITDSDLLIQPLAKAATIPSAWYTRPEFHEWDNAGIFSRTWQGVGHISRLKNSGDYILANIADNPIIVVREKDEKIRAFYNVCRHRGGPLALEDGHANALQCKYHGWTYRLDGTLRGTPQFEGVEDFHKNDYCLLPLPCEVWEGLIFVRLTEEGEPLTDVLSGIKKRIAPISLENKKFYSRVNYEINCNWKVYMDNYLEGYHLPFVHPALNKLLDYRNYVNETHEYYSLQYSPFRNGRNIYSADGGQAFYYFIFPNFMLNILPNRLQTNRVIPLSENKCIVQFDYFYDDVDSPQAQKVIGEDIAFSDEVQQEDIKICEYVQKGLQSSGYEQGRFSVECEAGVHHFQSLLKNAYRKGLENFKKK